MKKRVLLLVAIILLLGSTAVAYSYWDELSQDTNSQYEVGYGVRLEVPSEVKDSRDLVPAGSFYAAYEDRYTTEFVFEYTLTLEDALQTGMEANLAVDITDFQVNEIAKLFNVEGSLFTVNVGTDAVEATTSANGQWDFTDAFYFNNNEVVVTVTIELNNSDYDYSQAEYDAIAGFGADFNIGFELTNSASSGDLV